MTITLNHTIVPARDKQASAQFFADIFGLEVEAKSLGSPAGRFAVVRVGDTSLDFDDVEVFESNHYAFRVSEEEFDAILARVKEAGLTYSADPSYQNIDQINHLEGGRGVYFRDLNGHNLELLTRP